MESVASNRNEIPLDLSMLIGEERAKLNKTHDGLQSHYLMDARNPLKIWVSPLIHVCRKEVYECVIEEQQKSNLDALETVSGRRDGEGL